MHDTYHLIRCTSESSRVRFGSSRDWYFVHGIIDYTRHELCTTHVRRNHVRLQQQGINNPCSELHVRFVCSVPVCMEGNYHQSLLTFQSPGASEELLLRKRASLAESAWSRPSRCAASFVLIHTGTFRVWRTSSCFSTSLSCHILLVAARQHTLPWKSIVCAFEFEYLCHCALYIKYK